MRNSFFLTLVFSHFLLYADQDLVDIIAESDNNGHISLYAVNQFVCPVTIQLNIEMSHMRTVPGFQPWHVIPVGREKQWITTLIPEDGQAETGYTLSYALIKGDALSHKPNMDYIYTLPYQKGETHIVGQGYNERYSHQNLYALDFNMPVGTKILASRAGIVVDKKEDSNTGCANPSCQDSANYIIIYHPEDATFALYSHLQQDGVRVELGQQVGQGQWIGLSGNTGWSSGPHLHFEVHYQQLDSTISIPTLFKTNQGNIRPLEPGKAYGH